MKRSLILFRLLLPATLFFSLLVACKEAGKADHTSDSDTPTNTPLANVDGQDENWTVKMMDIHNKEASFFKPPAGTPHTKEPDDALQAKIKDAYTRTPSMDFSQILVSKAVVRKLIGKDGSIRFYHGVDELNNRFTILWPLNKAHKKVPVAGDLDVINEDALCLSNCDPESPAAWDDKMIAPLPKAQVAAYIGNFILAPGTNGLTGITLLREDLDKLLAGEDGEWPLLRIYHTWDEAKKGTADAPSAIIAQAKANGSVDWARDWFELSPKNICPLFCD